MRALLVDDSKEFMELLRRYLCRAFPDVEVTEYDLDQQGEPPSSFNWEVYDLLLLDYDLGGGRTGVDWLKTFGKRKGCPPTVFVTADESPYVVAEAMRYGARNYISKQDLRSNRLYEVVTELRDSDESGRVTDEDTIARDGVFLREQLALSESQPQGDIRTDYKFVRLIGQGAMSRVYLAERLADCNILGLKFITAGGRIGDDTPQRFHPTRHVYQFT